MEIWKNVEVRFHLINSTSLSLEKFTEENEMFEDTKDSIRSHKLKRDRQYNGDLFITNVSLRGIIKLLVIVYYKLPILGYIHI